MHIEIKPFADGWAWFLFDGEDTIASSKPFISRHAAAASAQQLMVNGVRSIQDWHDTNPAKKP